jgi:hypothetical protein
MAKAELRRAMDPNPLQGTSSTLVPRDSDAIKRLRGLVGQLADFQTAQDGKFGRMGFMLQIVAEELFEEMRQFDEITFARYLVFVARVTEWVATGDLDIIPEDFRPILAQIDGVELDLVSSSVPGNETNNEISASPQVEVVDAEIVADDG